MHMLRRTDGLLDRAAAALQRTVAADPDNAAVPHRLGTCTAGSAKLRDTFDE